MISEQIIEAVVARLKVYAVEQYEKGWDVVVECWGTDEYLETLNTVVTMDNINDEDALFKAAQADIQAYVELYEEQRSNTRFE
jgi:hypothetical protein